MKTKDRNRKTQQPIDEPKHLYWGRLVNDIQCWKVEKKGTLSVVDIESVLEELKQSKSLLKLAADLMPFDGEDGIITNKRRQIQEWLSNHDEVKGYSVNALGGTRQSDKGSATDSQD
jgi:hypothetical protein